MNDSINVNVYLDIEKNDVDLGTIADAVRRGLEHAVANSSLELLEYAAKPAPRLNRVLLELVVGNAGKGMAKIIDDVVRTAVEEGLQFMPNSFTESDIERGSTGYSYA